MQDGPITEQNHPEPITEFEMQAAMMLVRSRFPNCEFVIKKYIEQAERRAWDAARESGTATKQYQRWYAFSDWKKEHGK